ncbi:hypothetical protein E2R51_05675 [Jeotgalibacillus sp. S-D1]|uniref:hypothetical protein n=1 Tax=Jeotgalibacillus sp. S-D1 TaxID=2552189 RepID=UPI00105A76AD|nr:hypothetical protein [Jeotgalibacillus sp. S-D1]TDL35209.1 hypothetical protein E2R51_05675 [Jeotgalibacillus sp. S-D1]
MEYFNIYYVIIGIIISVIGLIVTMKIAKDQTNAKNERDESVPNEGRQHSIVLNPVFITYIAASVVVLGYVVYWMLKT